jgi:hypothetical protein
MKGLGFHARRSQERESSEVDSPDRSEGEQGQGGARVLIVAAAGEASMPTLLEAVRSRAAAGPVRFHLVLPDPAEHAELTDRQRRESRARGQAMLERALPLLSAAAGGEVDGYFSPRHDPMDAIEEARGHERVDEIILTTVHHNVSELLHLDLRRRVEHLGLPVTTVIGERTITHA